MPASSTNLAGLRIAHLIETDGPGGAERVVVQLATALQAAGAHNVVFLPANGEGWLAAELEGSGVAIEYFTIDRPLSPACARGLARSLRRHRVDVAHSHEFSMAIYGAWASWLAGVPHVVTMHGSRYYNEKLRRRLAMRLAAAASHKVAAVSDSLAAAIRVDLRVSDSTVTVLPNGVSHRAPDRVTLREELQLGADDRLIVAVGNLYPVKGHVHAIEALALLAGRYPSAHLAIAGRGELEAALTARARELGVSNRVHLLGLRADVPAVLAAADLFVMPSLSEGLPLALLEAMFAGRPIVATDVGQVRDTLGGGAAGIVVAPGDSAALADALDRVLSNPQEAQRLGRAAASRAAAEYDLSKMVQRYVAVYESALRRRVQLGSRLRHAAMVALLSALAMACSSQPPAALADARWPNEPAGLNVLADWGLEQEPPQLGDVEIPESPGWSIVFGTPPGPSRGWVRRVRDDSAPMSPPYVYDFEYPQGMAEGVAPGTVYFPRSPSGIAKFLPAPATGLPGADEIYVGFWWKPSKPFDLGPNGNKIAFLFNGGGNLGGQQFLILHTDGRLHVLPEYPGDYQWRRPNLSATVVTLGEWHRVEWYAQLSTGTLKWWLDGVLQGSHDDVRNPHPFDMFQFSPTWGGNTGAKKRQTDHYWFDHLRLSAGK